MSRLGAFVLLTIGMAGCFTSASDFSDDAAKFIQDNSDLHAALGVSGFTSVDCDDPEDRDVGTQFPCVGVDTDGREWAFEVELTGGGQYVVNVSKAP